MASSNGPGANSVPELKNLTIDNITENVNRINSQCANPRLKYIMDRLVTHLHDFARETRLSFDEWMAGIQFLTAVGQTCTDVRQVHFAPSLPPPRPPGKQLTRSGIHPALRHRGPLASRRLN
jgi:hypothetical protein